MKLLIRENTLLVVTSLLMIGLLLSGCSAEEDKAKEVVIAEQYGLAYAPLVVMRELKFLEAELDENYTVRWEKLGNTAAIREAMLSDHLDIGFMGIPPFLIGVDQGMEWRIMSGLTVSPLGLMTNDPTITTLEALKDQGKIALPQPGSIQHILLAMAAEENFGDAKYFDHQLISMKHPEGYQTLMTSDEVVAHFTSPPYIFQEQEEGTLYQLLSGEEAFGGEFSFIVGVCGEEFRSDEVAYKAFQEALKASISYMKSHEEASIELLSTYYELSEAVTRDYIYEHGISYDMEVHGLDTFSSFMYGTDYIKSSYEEEGLLW